MKRFYECGICGAVHLWDWNGDCRENGARFQLEDVKREDELFSWEERCAADGVILEPETAG